MKPTVRLLILGALLGAWVCLVSTFISCATTKAVVAVAKTCADSITSDVEQAVFNAANQETDTSFVTWMDQTVLQFGECVVGAEVDRIIATYSTAAVDAGTTVETIRARRLALMKTEDSVVIQRLGAWRAEHPPAPVVAPAR